MRTVAALYVEANGPYAALTGVDCWPTEPGQRGCTAGRTPSSRIRPARHGACWLDDA